MPINVLMPALSPTMTEGTLAKWVKSEGDTVASGDVLAEIETDKATMEVEAVDEGVLGKITVPAGTANVAVNTPIAVILEEGENASDIDTMDTSTPAPTASQETKETPETTTNTISAQPAGADIKNRDILYAQGAVIEPPKFDEESFWKDTETKTVREALREAMSEEMREHKEIYIMGEEVAEYNGAYKVTRSLYKHHYIRPLLLP